MVSGEAVTFLVESVVGIDSEGNDIVSTSEVTANALVAVGEQSDMGGIDHPDGDVADLTLYCHSREVGDSLRGATASVPRLGERRFLVMGDPTPWPHGWATSHYDTVVRCREMVG